MDKSLSLLILWLQLDCELEGFGNGQLPDIPPQGRGKLRELYLHGFWEFLWRAKK